MTARAASRSAMLRISLSVITLVVVVAVGFIGRRLATQEIDPSVPDIPPTAELVAQGEYLARAADCAASRVAPGMMPNATVT